MKKYFENFGHTCELSDDDNEDVKVDKSKKAFTKWKTIDPTSALTLLHFNSHSSIVNELQHHLLYFPSTLHPFSRLVMVWEWFMLLVFLFGLFYGPLTILLYVEDMSVSKSGSMAVMMTTKIICIVDIIRRFFTGFVDERSNMIVLSKRQIAEKYLRGLFTLDVIMNFPMFLAFYFIENFGENKLYYLRLLNALRIVRLPTVIGYWEKTLLRLGVDDKYIDVFSLVLYWIVAIHWVACFHLTPGLLAVKFKSMPVNAWFDKPHFKSATVNTRYIMCLSKGLRAIMGAGHIKSLQDEENFDKIFSSLVTVLGRIAIFVTLAYMFEIIQGIKSSSLRYDELMVELEKYTEHHNLPPSTKEKLKKNYDFMFSKRYFNEKEILNTVSTSLRQQILVHNTRPLVENSSFFQNLPSYLVLKIISALSVELYLEGDVIYTIGEQGLSVYFILSGSVAFTSASGKEICHFSDGDYFGEVTLLSNIKHQYAKAVALETTECYKLGRNDFQKLIQSYPDLLQKVESLANDRVEQALMTEEREKHRKPFEYDSVNQQKFTGTRQSSTFSFILGN